MIRYNTILAHLFDFYVVRYGPFDLLMIKDSFFDYDQIFLAVR